MAGYISPLAVLGVSNENPVEPAGELRKRIVERVPTVTVDANGSASINISLVRAAAVSGTILYDDSSPAPAPGLDVKLRERKESKWVPVHYGSDYWKRVFNLEALVDTVPFHPRISSSFSSPIRPKRHLRCFAKG